MSQVSIFDFEDESVRSVLIDGEPWFVGKDVCRCLGIADHNQALDRLDDDERLGGYNVPTQSDRGGRTAIVISEPGVYRLVFTSRTDAAERFKRWLAHEVIPAIRKTGQYVAPERPTPAVPAAMVGDLDFDELRKAAPVLREWRLLYGKAAARRLARRLPIPQVDEPLIAEADAAPDPTGDPAVFAGDMLVRAQGARTSATSVYAAYLEWCEENEVAPMTQTGFGRRLATAGWTKGRTGGRVFYVDLHVSDDAKPDA